MNYYYITGHGIGPKTIPTDLLMTLNIKVIDESNFKTIFKTSRELSKEELDLFDISRWCPKCSKPYLLYPSISREDNVTRICPNCGVSEALATFNKYDSWRA